MLGLLSLLIAGAITCALLLAGAVVVHERAYAAGNDDPALAASDHRSGYPQPPHEKEHALEALVVHGAQVEAQYEETLYQDEADGRTTVGLVVSGEVFAKNRKSTLKTAHAEGLLVTNNPQPQSNQQALVEEELRYSLKFSKVAWPYDPASNNVSTRNANEVATLLTPQTTSITQLMRSKTGDQDPPPLLLRLPLIKQRQ